MKGKKFLCHIKTLVNLFLPEQDNINKKRENITGDYIYIYIYIYMSQGEYFLMMMMILVGK